MERIMSISGAYDGTAHPRNYGIGSMRIFMAVKGAEGGVSCTFGTSWYLPQNQASSLALYTKGYPFDACDELMAPKGWDIGIHAKEPQYAGQTPLANCDLTDGECYCDGSSLWAQEKWLPVFLHEGSEGVFDRLESYYRETFEDGKQTDLTPKPRTFEDPAS